LDRDELVELIIAGAEKSMKVGDQSSISPCKPVAPRSPCSSSKERSTASHGEHTWRKSNKTRQLSSPTLQTECPCRRHTQGPQNHFDKDKPVEVIVAGVEELTKVGDQSDTSTCATDSPHAPALGQFSRWLCENGIGSIRRKFSAPILVAPPVTPVIASPPVRHRCIDTGALAAVEVTDRHDPNKLVSTTSTSARWV
jgi:hypothetical protein